MFKMTSEITVEGFKNPIKPTALKWKRSITDYSDTATISLPAIAMLKKNADSSYQNVETGLQFKEGLKVEIACGYNGDNKTRFKGFIRRINATIPLEIECEGYSYQLRKKHGFNKSYKAGTKLKTLLTDLIEGTSITLSSSIPDVTIDCPFNFPMAKGTEVLDWLKEKMLMTSYFNGPELYVGLRYADLKQTIKLRLGWNVIKDNELKFNERTEFTEVRITYKQNDGKTQSTPAGKNVKQVKMEIRVDEASMKMIADDQKKQLANRGYEGALTTFLVPFAEPGMAAGITDKKYPKREGKYFIEAVEGEYSSGGGRQKITLGATL